MLINPRTMTRFSLPRVILFVGKSYISFITEPAEAPRLTPIAPRNASTKGKPLEFATKVERITKSVIPKKLTILPIRMYPQQISNRLGGCETANMPAKARKFVLLDFLGICPPFLLFGFVGVLKLSYAFFWNSQSKRISTKKPRTRTSTVRDRPPKRR